MEQKAEMKKIMINLGVVLGLVSIMLSVVTYTLGSNMFQPHWSVQTLGFLLLVGILIYGIKEFKKGNGGYLKLSEALKVGMGIAAISAVLGAIYFIIFANIIEPNYFDLYMDFQREAAIEQNPTVDVEQLEVGLEMSKPFMNTGFFVGIQFVLALFFGFIVSLIAGLVMKKDNPYEGIQE